MATPPAAADPAGLAWRHVQVAVFAKAPVAGQAKTRLIPALGPQGAARLQRQFMHQAVSTAQAAGLGAVTLWCAPDAGHRCFRALRQTTGIACHPQGGGDLGERMHRAFEWHCPQGPLLLIGTDCPALRPEHLRQAAQALLQGADTVFIPAEDGGYVLVGLQQPQPALFLGMTWSTPQVMADSRQRAHGAGLRLNEQPPLWDVDLPADLLRYRAWLAAGGAPAQRG